MALLDVPSEILYEILAPLVHSTGVRANIRLRLVCWAFNKQVESAVFNLPLDVIAREGLSKPMAARLVLSKLGHSNASQRPLCHAIIQTTSYLSTMDLCGTSQQEFIEALADAAAHSTFVWDLVSKLEPTENRASHPHAVKDAALIAAIYTKHVGVVKYLLDNGADVAVKTRFFGEPLAVAARVGCTEISQLLIDSRDWVAPNEYFTRLRYRHAMDAAAETGQKEILLMLMELDNEPQQASTYDRALIKAARTGQESTVKLLLHRQSLFRYALYNEQLFLDFFRTLIRGNYQALIQATWHDASRALRQKSLGLLLEDSCRYRHVGITEFVFTKSSKRSLKGAVVWSNRGRIGNVDIPPPKPSQLSLEDLSGALFWAARSGHTALVNTFVDFLAGSDKAIVKALAGAASGKQHDLFRHLLERLGVERTDDSLPSHFSDAIHLIYPHLPPRIPHPAVDDSSVLDQRQRREERAILRRAVTSGDLEGVIAALCKYPAMHTNSRSIERFGLLSTAAQTHHHEILLYLLENIQTCPIRQPAASTSILQIIMDYGWDINNARERYTQFASLLYNVHLVRWLLSMGAHPTATVDYDMTTTSRAVMSCDISMVELLLEKSGSVEHGQLLHRAVKYDKADQLERVELLLNLGCPIDAILYQNHPWSRMEYEAKAIEAGTPLFKAAVQGSADVVEYLLQRGADPAIKSTHGRTALQAAEAGGRAGVIDVLKKWTVDCR